MPYKNQWFQISYILNNRIDHCVFMITYIIRVYRHTILYNIIIILLYHILFQLFRNNNVKYQHVDDSNYLSYRRLN